MINATFDEETMTQVISSSVFILCTKTFGPHKESKPDFPHTDILL